MVMIGLTLGYCQIVFLPWFIVARVHQCGPILDNYSSWDIVVKSIHSSTYLTYIYETVSFFPVIWIGIAVIMLF